jgi:NitT/TauT family transport system substrate-binding protein
VLPFRSRHRPRDDLRVLELTRIKRRDAVRLLGGVALTGCTGASAFAQSAATVTMATTPVDSGAEPYYGYDSGIFKAAGIDARLQSGSANGSAIATAIAAGSIDVGVSNIVSIVQAHANHIPFVIIGPGGLYSSRTPSTYLFVPNASPFKTAADLNGKTIGVNTLRGLPQYGTQAWLEKNGAHLDTIKFTEVGPLDMLVALSSGRVDAGAFVEPFATQARTIGRAVCAPFDAIAPAFLITAVFTTLDWARAHRDTVRLLQNAFAKTAAWANKNHAQSGDILMKYAQLKPETLKTMQRTIFAEHLDLSQVQPVIDLTAKYGGITAFPAGEVIFQP